MKLAEFQERMDEMQVIATKEALAFFLMKEIKRHERDIERAWVDIGKLKKQGVKIPDYDSIDADTWIEPDMKKRPKNTAWLGDI